MTIQELMEKRAKLWDEARTFLDSKRNNSGILSEDDSKIYDAMEKQILDLTAEIDRLERLEKISQKMNAATTKPVVTTPGTHVTVSEKPSTATDEYKTAFWNNIRNRNWIDVRNDLQVGTDSEGGYLVPDEFVRL
jgi:HK97 family phage major capsid protein